MNNIERGPDIYSNKLSNGEKIDSEKLNEIVGDKDDLAEQTKKNNPEKLDKDNLHPEMPRGINYLVERKRSKIFFEKLGLKQESSQVEFQRDVEIIKEELKCNAIRIAGPEVEQAVKLAKTVQKNGLTPWLSPRFGGESFESTINRFEGYLDRCIESGLEKCPLIVANELIFDCRDVMPEISSGSHKHIHEKIHVSISEGNRPDVTAHVQKLVSIARERGWKGLLTYAAFAYEQVDWETIEDSNFYVGANLYWERDRETGKPKPASHYRMKILTLVKKSGGRPILITEFGASPHEDTLAAGGGSFALRGEVDWDAQKSALQKYLEVLDEFPKIGYFLYTFDEPLQSAREASYGIVKKDKSSTLMSGDVELTPAGKTIAQFNSTRSETVGIEIDTSIIEEIELKDRFDKAYTKIRAILDGIPQGEDNRRQVFIDKIKDIARESGYGKETIDALSAKLLEQEEEDPKKFTRIVLDTIK